MDSLAAVQPQEVKQSVFRTLMIVTMITSEMVQQQEIMLIVSNQLIIAFQDILMMAQTIDVLTMWLIAMTDSKTMELD